MLHSALTWGFSKPGLPYVRREAIEERKLIPRSSIHLRDPSHGNATSPSPGLRSCHRNWRHFELQRNFAPTWILFETVLLASSSSNPTHAVPDPPQRQQRSYRTTMSTSERNRSDSSLCASDDRSSVSFSTIEIHEHPIILGNGRAASGSGPCLEIDWMEQSNILLNLEEYESMRYQRRNKEELLMPGKLRTNLLLDTGYTMRELSEVTSKSSNAGGKSKNVAKRISSLFSKKH
eukprot:scaffold1870_cov104-Cylindrotheca_fusiformis.AAC.4